MRDISLPADRLLLVVLFAVSGHRLKMPNTGVKKMRGCESQRGPIGLLRNGRP